MFACRGTPAQPPELRSRRPLSVRMMPEPIPFRICAGGNRHLPDMGLKRRRGSAQSIRPEIFSRGIAQDQSVTGALLQGCPHIQPKEVTVKTNQTPFNDPSDNTTGCCPRFNAKGWGGQTLHFKDKPFVRATTHSVAHLPIDMGKVFSRVLANINAAHAVDPAHSIVMSRDLSAFSAEHLFAVNADVPGEERVTLSGEYVTKVFEGPFSQVRKWHDEMQDLAKEKGRTAKSVWFYYTTCPKCAKVYGKNPVVGLVELGAAA
ncbi:MAG: hydrolase [Cereibacter sp.]